MIFDKRVLFNFPALAIRACCLLWRPNFFNLGNLKFESLKVKVFAVLKLLFLIFCCCYLSKNFQFSKQILIFPTLSDFVLLKTINGAHGCSCFQLLYGWVTADSILFYWPFPVSHFTLMFDFSARSKPIVCVREHLLLCWLLIPLHLLISGHFKQSHFGHKLSLPFLVQR